MPIITVQYNCDNCSECPYCVNELGGYPIIPECMKANKVILEDINTLPMWCPFLEKKREQTKIH